VVAFSLSEFSSASTRRRFNYWEEPNSVFHLAASYPAWSASVAKKDEKFSKASATSSMSPASMAGLTLDVASVGV
jgi:hypothetical protein